MRKDILSAKEYSFLKENPDLANIAYIAISGSHRYGTNTENSDVDMRGFLIEDKKYLLGLGVFEQFEDIPTDTVIYGLKKYFALCCSANPNALEILGVDRDCVAVINDAGQKVLDNAGLFLSKRVIQSFGNYASAQLRRLSNALCHDRYDAARREEHLRETLTNEIEHFNHVYKSFDKNAIKLYLNEMGEGGVLADIHLEKYPVRDFVGIYSEMRETIKTYDKVNHRNRKKDDTHLFKHAMHLIRLLMTGTDILNGRGIITKRDAEHDFLMDIRNGKFSFKEIFAFADEYRKVFDTAARNTKLPDGPDLTRIESLQIQIFEECGAR